MVADRRYTVEELEHLLRKVRTVRMTVVEQEVQRRSFAYGNTRIENDLITRTMIDEAAERLARQS
jgi:hypothetical protein